MQTSDKTEISEELKKSYDFQVLEKSINDLIQAIAIIEDGIQDEFKHVTDLKQIIGRQKRWINQIKQAEVVEMQVYLEEENYLRFCRAALKQAATAIEGLNGYLNDRMRQLNILKERRKQMIKRHSLSNVIQIKKV